ncbi:MULTISPECIES: rhodanese-like domain-containing protein [Spirulina sp. CCY15215]|uniref:rhodanese-like domain-containing protein n=1 Tax=Spirulina sp. CCY15215 TaxID=2767591 RepID=UPI00194F624F
MTTDRESTSNITEIAPSTLQQWLDQDLVTLVDVREPSEYAGEHISGAKRISLSTFDPSEVPQEQGKNLVLYCRSQSRSQQAAKQLLAAGWTEIYELKGGINAWKAANYPLKVNKNAPISMMRQVQIVAGSLVFTGTLLGAFVSPWFLILSGFVGAGLVFAGVSNTCAMAMLLAKLPYNQRV